MRVIKELLESRSLIWDLSLNDFKNKFSGSAFGVFWAFVQPIVTVTIYWFIFDRGIGSKAGGDVPYLLWLIAGMCSWFFFSDAMNAASGCLFEYSYIVKKVVFKVTAIPVIKIISVGFVHAFFIMITMIVFKLYGYEPTVYNIQMLYYSFATFVLALGLSYLVSAISVFFKDMTQIVSILLQYGMWLLPIMLSDDQFPAIIRGGLKYNPMYYAVEGYRDSLIRHVWFWEHPGQTVYFWCVVLLIFGLGSYIFNRLKPHFADVL